MPSPAALTRHKHGVEGGCQADVVRCPQGAATQVVKGKPGSPVGVALHGQGAPKHDRQQRRRGRDGGARVDETATAAAAAAAAACAVACAAAAVCAAACCSSGVAAAGGGGCRLPQPLHGCLGCRVVGPEVEALLRLLPAGAAAFLGARCGCPEHLRGCTVHHEAPVVGGGQLQDLQGSWARGGESGEARAETCREAASRCPAVPPCPHRDGSGGGSDVAAAQLAPTPSQRRGGGDGSYLAAAQDGCHHVVEHVLVQAMAGQLPGGPARSTVRPHIMYIYRPYAQACDAPPPRRR